jgi:hypothetical protein
VQRRQGQGHGRPRAAPGHLRGTQRPGPAPPLVAVAATPRPRSCLPPLVTDAGGHPGAAAAQPRRRLRRRGHGRARTRSPPWATASTRHRCRYRPFLSAGAWCWCATVRALGTRRAASRAAATGRASRTRGPPRRRRRGTWCAVERREWELRRVCYTANWLETARSRPPVP